jgi:hypothetical protein
MRRVMASMVSAVSLLVVASCITNEPQRCFLWRPENRFSLIETFQGEWGACEAQGYFAPAGGVMIMSNILSREHSGDDVNITLIDKNGERLWSRTLQKRSGWSVCPTRDGGGIVVGSTMPQRPGGYHLCPQCDLILSKIDGDGKELWTTTLRSEGRSDGKCAQETSDGGYIVTGSESMGGFSRMCLVKTDSQGQISWNRVFSGEGTTQGFSVQQTRDWGYIVAGVRIYDEDANVYVMKTDTEGREVWSQSFGGPDADGGYAVQETADGQYVIVGATKSCGAGDSDVYVTMIGTDGEVEWSKAIGWAGDQVGRSIAAVADGGFLIAGYYSDSQRPNKRDPLVIRIDKNGNEVWSRVLEVPGNCVDAKVKEMSEGVYALICAGLRPQGDGHPAVFGLFRLAVE